MIFHSKRRAKKLVTALWLCIVVIAATMFLIHQLTSKSSIGVIESKEYSDNEHLQFSDLGGLEFVFASGAGAWRTTLTIQSDGSYEAYYCDSDAGCSYLYTKGFAHECKFHGKFSSLTKTGPYQYSFKCESIELDGELGNVRFEDDVAFVSTTPYGFENADEFQLYLPGKQISELPSGFLDWSNGYAEGEILEIYGLYNVGGEEGFVVWQETKYEDLGIEEQDCEPTLSPAPSYSAAEIIKLQEQYTDKDTLSFSELIDNDFYSIREGMIGPELIIQPDGKFRGSYSETFSYSCEDDSEGTTTLDSKYSGQFSSLSKTGPYEFTLKCNALNVDGTVGEEKMVDGEKVFEIEPCGFENADEFKLYLPGKKVSELPEELLEWEPELRDEGVISEYILYNVGGEKSFVNIPG